MNELNLLYEMVINNTDSVGLYLVIVASTVGAWLVLSGFKITRHAKDNNKKREEFIEQIIRAKRLRLEEKENLIRELYH